MNSAEINTKKERLAEIIKQQSKEKEISKTTPISYERIQYLVKLDNERLDLLKELKTA